MKINALIKLTNSTPVLFFDGYCVLCNWAVRWILRNEGSNQILFASLNSETGEEIKEYLQNNTTEIPDSIVLMKNSQVYLYSDAFLQIIPYLKWYWKGLSVLKMIPRPLRDFLYKWIASHRYKWFGKYDSCPLPDKNTINRFI